MIYHTHITRAAGRSLKTWQKRILICFLSLLLAASFVASGTAAMAEETPADADGISLQSTGEDSRGVKSEPGGEGRPEPGGEGRHGPGSGDGHGPRPQISSEIKDTNTAAPQIVEHPAAQAYALLESPTDDVPEYTCSAMLPEGTAEGAITFTWYVDGNAVYSSSQNAVNGEAVTNTYRADILKDLTEYGVHPVYCVVSMETTTADEDGNETTNTVSNQSMSVNYILCNGVNNNSLLTFSDVHESFSSIGNAVSNIMSADGEGLIPALIVCTADWKNSERWMGGDETSDNYKKTKDVLISRLLGQSGGIDTVFVSGNHENGAAARDANIEANLGADKEYDGAGVIFDSALAAADGKTGSSSDLKDLVVYGINYENLKTGEGMSYENVLGGLEQYLEGLRKDYAGQLIVISAHAGLHVVDGWGGREEYNIDKSNEMVALLNHYSDLGMNITFLFGHDHSRRENEMLLTPGDSITSTVRYALKDTDEDSAKETQVIRFTYGHAGYITQSIGGHQRYTVMSWTDLRTPTAVVSRTLYQLEQDGQASEVEVLSAPTGIITGYHLTDPQREYAWQEGDETGITIHTDGDLETVFTGVLVDGVKLNAEDYTAKGSAAVVTLSPSFLNTLEKGTHSLKILFSNDTEDRSDVEAVFYIISPGCPPRCR